MQGAPRCRACKAVAVGDTDGHGRAGLGRRAMDLALKDKTVAASPGGSKLEQLRGMTVVVADTGDIEAVRRLKPQDCTTNPTLLLKAAESPAYAGLVDEVLAWGRRQSGTREAVVAGVCDRLAVSFG